MHYIKWFKDVTKKDVSLVGGKGANLGEMFHHFPIPNGFCVTTNVFKEHVQHVQEAIDAHLKGLDVEDTQQLDIVAKQVRSLIIKEELPEKVVGEIEEAFATLGADFVAVRSSATTEDLGSASFAGQHATFLNVKERGLFGAIKECFASLFTSRAIYYRIKKGFTHAEAHLCVVIQEMVNSEKAGVIFTVNPVTNDHKEMIIEGAYGLGESVVSGMLTPHSYIVEKEGGAVKEKNISELTWGHFRGEEGETVKRDIDHGSISILTDEEVGKLVELCCSIEKHYGGPQDIEWAFADGKFFITQSRPITTL